MFNFFKKDTYNKKIPDDYKHLLTQAAYEEMLDIILQYFKEKGEPVVKVENGYIITKGEEGKDLQHQYGLDNLVRLVAAAAKDDKEAVIYNHFNRAYYDMRPLEYFKKDYDAAKQYLKILIKPDAILSQKGSMDVVYKTILPGTCSVLVFDYDNKFAYLYHEMIKEWDKTVDELFEQAMDNISNEEISVVGLTLSEEEAAEDSTESLPDEGDEEVEGEEVEEVEAEEEDLEDQDAFVFMNPDFAAPVLSLLEQKAPFAIGEYGSIVAIPCKGYAIAAPINGGEVFDKLSPLSVIVVKFFNEQPGNITTDLYWYYQEQFELMPEKSSVEKEGYTTIVLPQKLIQLLNEA